jgi:hypothetical protein
MQHVEEMALHGAPAWQRMMMMFVGEDRSVVENVMNVMKVPAFERRLIIAFSQVMEAVKQTSNAVQVLANLKAMDAYRNPDLFFEIMTTAHFLRFDDIDRWRMKLLRAYRASVDVRAKMIDNIDNLVGKEVGDAIDAMRLERIRYAIS